MSVEDLVSAWKHRGVVSEGMPPNPAAEMEIDPDLIDDIEGGTATATLDPCCTWISLSLGVSALACDSIMHGTCSGWTWGCCS